MDLAYCNSRTINPIEGFPGAGRGWQGLAALSCPISEAKKESKRKPMERRMQCFAAALFFAEPQFTRPQGEIQGHFPHWITLATFGDRWPIAG